jgi:hypothetical protein
LGSLELIRVCGSSSWWMRGVDVIDGVGSIEGVVLSLGGDSAIRAVGVGDVEGARSVAAPVWCDWILL